MSRNPNPAISSELFSAAEIARAAGVSNAVVRRALKGEGMASRGALVPGTDAVRLVRQLRAAPVASRNGRRTLALMSSGTLHGVLLALLILANSLDWLHADEVAAVTPDRTPAHLVYLISPGPGGGGGGGGLQVPIPPPRAQVAAPVRKKISSPIPPRVERPTTPPQRPKPLPVVVPKSPLVPVVQPAPPPVVPAVITRPDPKPPAPAVQAPVVPVAADPVDAPGLPAGAANQSPSPGPGSGGGIGSGTGTGLGEGHGSGIGDGSGGGTGGGPYHPGTDILPPSLTREVKADYTADARRRAIEGDVALEIVVRRDGSVGNIRVLQTLAGGLEQKAVDAVRQWRFSPATRHGSAVDVVVEVSVAFKLR